jgi:hypothetical protein
MKPAKPSVWVRTKPKNVRKPYTVFNGEILFSKPREKDYPILEIHFDRTIKDEEPKLV